MSVRVSPISRTAALLIIALGAFTLFAGVVAQVTANVVAGAAILVLGVVLYWLLYRFTRKVTSEVKAAQGG